MVFLPGVMSLTSQTAADRRLDFAGGLACLHILLAAAGAASAQSPRAHYTIGPNVQVSASQSSVRHYETYVAADRENAGHLIACAYTTGPDNKTDTVFYVSFDSGATWAHTLTVPVAVDPSCAIGPDGGAFAASIHDLADEKGTPVLSVYRSADGGRTWTPSPVSVEAPPVDRAYLTVDDTGSSFRGQVYVHAYRFSRTPPAAVLFFPGKDGGRRFENMLVSPATSFPKPWFFPGNGIVGNDGSFFAIAAELDDTRRNMSLRTDAESAPSTVNAALDIFISRDGGKSLVLDGKIEGVFYDWRVPQLSMPALALDRSRGPFRGRLYAAWPDARYGRHTQILFSSSRDQGRTWDAPKVVGDDGDAGSDARRNNFMPAIAVNGNGVVGVAWYDRRDNPDNLGYYVRFAASLNGGKTWLPSVRVSAVPHVADEDTRKNSGDTAGLTAGPDGIFHPVWIDNRTGIPQMWTATVKVGTR